MNATLLSNRLLALWALVAPPTIFGAYVRIAYARWPVASAGGEVPPVWLSPIAYGVALLVGVLAMIVLVRRDWVARGLLILYVLAMPFFVWAAGFWVACRHGDCI